MPYAYSTRIAPVSADVTTLGTLLAQRQSDVGTTNGGITASGGASTVPQLGVDGADLGKSYLQAMADCILASTGYQGQSDAAASGGNTNSGTFVDAGYSTWSFTPPVAKTYLLHVDLSCYMTVAADSVTFEIQIDGASPGGQPANIQTFYFNTLTEHTRISWRQPVAFASTSAKTIKLRWKTTTAGTINSDGSDARCFTITG